MNTKTRFIATYKHLRNYVIKGENYGVINSINIMAVIINHLKLKNLIQLVNVYNRMLHKIKFARMIFFLSFAMLIAITMSKETENVPKAFAQLPSQVDCDKPLVVGTFSFNSYGKIERGWMRKQFKKSKDKSVKLILNSGEIKYFSSVTIGAYSNQISEYDIIRNALLLTKKTDIGVWKFL